jgi:hypothetical protein
VRYGRPRNPARKGAVREQIMAQLDRYRDRIHENNALDLELYEFVKREIWPKQVAVYGAERLAREVETEFAGPEGSNGDRLREFANDAVRRTVYRTIVRVRGWRARRAGVPYIRQ